MDYLLKWLLKFHREKVMQAVITDYFGDIPTKVSDSAITILSEQRAKVDRWLAFQSYLIQRRMVSDPKSAQVLYGMCVQIKLMAHMIGAAAPIPTGAEGTKSAAEAARLRVEEESKSFEEAIKGAEAFAKSGKVEEKT